VLLVEELGFVFMGSRNINVLLVEELRFVLMGSRNLNVPEQ
jgi:hypothetical protein